MEYQPNISNENNNWIFLLKELYEKNCKKYEGKKHNAEYSPKDLYQ